VGDTEDMQLARTCGSGWVPGSASSQASNYVRHIRRPRGNWGVLELSVLCWHWASPSAFNPPAAYDASVSL
jgi:hypothetical protein